VAELLPESLRPLVLASASPQRRTLLQSLTTEFEVRPAEVDETPPAGVPLDVAARAIAKRKSDAVAPSIAHGTILASDTVVDVDGVLLGKPGDAGDARRMLKLLAGRAHAVHTSVVLRHRPSDVEVEDVATTRVHFKPLTNEDVDRYVDSGEPFGKAGGYAVQGRAAWFVAGLEGDLDVVIGLPCKLVRRMVARLAGRVAARH
jgi:septum formation protein